MITEKNLMVSQGSGGSVGHEDMGCLSVAHHPRAGGLRARIFSGDSAPSYLSLHFKVL